MIFGPLMSFWKQMVWMDKFPLFLCLIDPWLILISYPYMFFLFALIPLLDCHLTSLCSSFSQNRLWFYFFSFLLRNLSYHIVFSPHLFFKAWRSVTPLHHALPQHLPFTVTCNIDSSISLRRLLPPIKYRVLTFSISSSPFPPLLLYLR